MSVIINNLKDKTSYQVLKHGQVLVYNVSTLWTFYICTSNWEWHSAQAFQKICLLSGSWERPNSSYHLHWEKDELSAYHQTLRYTVIKSAKCVTLTVLLVLSKTQKKLPSVLQEVNRMVLESSSKTKCIKWKDCFIRNWCQGFFVYLLWKVWEQDLRRSEVNINLKKFTSALNI